MQIARFVPALAQRSSVGRLRAKTESRLYFEDLKRQPRREKGCLSGRTKTRRLPERDVQTE